MMPDMSPLIGSADLLITDADIYLNDQAAWLGSRHRRQGRPDPRRRLPDPVTCATCVGASTEVLSLPGRLVVPGFQDAHIHARSPAATGCGSGSTTCIGREAYLTAIAEYASANPDEPWIVGGGWAMESFPGGLPRKEDLDAIVPDRPVFLFNRTCTAPG